MTVSLQPSNVAGTFYPADPAALAATVDTSLAKAGPSTLAPKAVIAPHAGHVYSGDVAGAAYSLLAKRRGEIKRVVLLGPNHRTPVRGLALSPADAWATPFGPLPVDRPARDAIARLSDVVVAPQPFANEHSLEVHLPFIHRALGEVEILPILVGEAYVDQLSEVLDAVWGGPETVVVVSSDLSHFHDYDTCRTKDAQTAAGIERLDNAVCEGHRACGYFAIAGLIDQARRRDLRVTALDVRNSGDTQGGRDRVVGYGSFAFEYAHTARLENSLHKTLLEVAREVVKQAALHGGNKPNLDLKGPMPRELLAQRATFVTINSGGKLRGCRGSIAPFRSLIEDVADNAWKSGFGDPRFPPLTEAELDGLDFHVSILSTARRFFCQNEEELLHNIRPDIDGLILREGAKQALFLPAVWKQLNDPAQFVQQLKLKAGLPAGYWSGDLETFRFETESFGER